MFLRTVSDMERLIVDNLHRIRQIPFDVIIHLPRSGTIPASILATYVSKPLASIDEYCAGWVNTRKCEVTSTHRILLVDDSIRTGEQMKEATSRIREVHPKCILYTLCTFGTLYARDFQPTLILEEHEDGDYIYPWFMWKTKRIGECAVDMDGVLCRDCTPQEDDDGPLYKQFLETAEPKFLTKYKIGAIITSRLEKYRPETEAWLKRQGITYNKLIMGPWKTKQERKGGQAEFKAYHYRRGQYKLFIESSEKEAVRMRDLVEKPVWSIETMNYTGFHD